MIELISIHIPKTGGRSLRRVLKKVYGDALELRHEKEDYEKTERGRFARPLENKFPKHKRALHVHLGVHQLKAVIGCPSYRDGLNDPVLLHRLDQFHHGFLIKGGSWLKRVDSNAFHRDLIHRGG